MGDVDSTYVWREQKGNSIKVEVNHYKNKNLPDVSMKQVAEHNTPDDCWIVIGEKVYKIPESWTKIHPGGHLPLKAMAGKDATDAFVQYHPNSVYKMISRFHIANVA